MWSKKIKQNINQNSTLSKTYGALDFKITDFDRFVLFIAPAIKLMWAKQWVDEFYIFLYTQYTMFVILHSIIDNTKNFKSHSLLFIYYFHWRKSRKKIAWLWFGTTILKAKWPEANMKALRNEYFPRPLKILTEY